MNLYNLEDFKCDLCIAWFHPVHAKPYAMDCGHSLCSKCIDKTRGRDILCPHHRKHQNRSEVTLNQHIQEALVRLLKNNERNQKVHDCHQDVSAMR